MENQDNTIEVVGINNEENRLKKEESLLLQEIEKDIASILEKIGAEDKLDVEIIIRGIVLKAQKIGHIREEFKIDSDTVVELPNTNNIFTK